MEEMSDDEIFALLVALVGTGWLLWRWILPLATVRTMRGEAPRLVLACAMSAGFAWLLFVLTHWAARDVRDDWRYIGLFLACGAVFLGGALEWGALLAVHLRDDAIERMNMAAGFACAGLVAGMMLLFAGANIGEGPTIWTTLGPAALAALTWAALWAILQVSTGIAEDIAVERDAASGLRLGGMLAGNGIILGRAVAGDWQSAAGTLEDFWRQGSPAVLLAVAASLCQVYWRPRVGRRSIAWIHGALPAAVMIGAGLAWVIYLGKP